MTLYTQDVILNIPAKKREINDYEIILTIKNSSLNILVQKKVNCFIFSLIIFISLIYFNNF